MSEMADKVKDKLKDAKDIVVGYKDNLKNAKDKLKDAKDTVVGYKDDAQEMGYDSLTD